MYGILKIQKGFLPAQYGFRLELYETEIKKKEEKEMMKPEELSIGSWVQLNGYAEPRPHDIRGIRNDDGIWFVMLDDVWWELRYIDPIPLTPSNLLSFGLKVKEDNISIGCYWADDLEQSLQTIVEFKFYRKPIEGVTALLKCWTNAKSGYGLNEVQSCDIQYVHQLQNALRIVGIDKEIKL